MPETDFVELTLSRPCRAFRVKEKTHLNDHPPHTVKVGMGGCVAIRRDPNGGFDIHGEDGQSYWVADANIQWGKKA